MAITKITGASIAADSIDGTKIADDAINSEHITDGGVDNAHIGDLAATKLTGTIASGRLSASNLGSGTIPIGRIADDAITNAKMADDAIDSAQIADGAVDNVHLATGIASSKLTGALPAIDGANLTGIDPSTTYQREIQADINFLAMRMSTEKFTKDDQFIDTFINTSGIDTANSTYEQVTGGYCVGGTIVNATTGNASFSYTGSAQSWTVVSGATTVNARIWAAGGSSDYSNNRGGHGSAIVGDIDTSGISTLTIVVGRGGAYTTVGGDGGGGGGFSGVFSSSTLNQANSLLIAGGGGGAGDGNSTRGGDGGGNNSNKDGEHGLQGGTAGATHAGKGGTQSAAGAQGNNGTGSNYWDNCNGYGASAAGGALSAGDGGYTCSTAGSRSFNPVTKPTTAQGGGGRGGFEPGGYVGGGGGGGGYWGGGGGSAGSWSDGGAGAGAGSSYAKSGSTSSVTYYAAQSLTSGAGYDASKDGTGTVGAAGQPGKVYLSWSIGGTVSGGSDLTLQSISTTAATVPTSADLSILMEDGAGTATLNTDIKGYVSRNGGTTWAQGTLVSDGSWGTNKKIIAFTGEDISGQSSGTSMKYKITTHNQSGSKETRIHSIALSWA